MKGFAIHFAKAMAATAVVVTAITKVGPMLPDALIVKGYDIRPYVVGGAAILVMSMLPSSVKPVEVPK